MLASLLCLYDPLMHSEVPVHVSSLLLPSFCVGLEASPALGARRAESLVNGVDKMGSEPTRLSVNTCLVLHFQ